MLRPMIPLTFSVAILDELTRRTCLETNAPIIAAAIGAAVMDRHRFHPKWPIGAAALNLGGNFYPNDRQDDDGLAFVTNY